MLYLVLDESSSLNVGPRLVSDLHDELGLGLDAEVEDGEVDGGAESLADWFSKYGPFVHVRVEVLLGAVE